MKLVLFHDQMLTLLQLGTVAKCFVINVLSGILFVIANLFNSFFNDTIELSDDREVRENFGEDGQGIAYLDVIFGL